MKYQSIVFSGLPGAGKSTLVEKLSEIYRRPVHSVGQMWRAHYEKLHPEHDITLEEYSRIATSEDRFRVNQEAAEIFSGGTAIGDSRYAIYLCGKPVFLVFLTADVETRAARALGSEKYKCKSLEDIQKILEDREAIDVEVGREMYDYDYRDPKFYNLVINTGTLTVEEEVAIIGSAIGAPGN